MNENQIVTLEEISAYINDNAPGVEVSWTDLAEEGANTSGKLSNEIKIEDLDHDEISVTIKNSWGERTESCVFYRAGLFLVTYKNDRTKWVCGNLSW